MVVHDNNNSKTVQGQPVVQSYLITITNYIFIIALLCCHFYTKSNNISQFKSGYIHKSKTIIEILKNALYFTKAQIIDVVVLQEYKQQDR